MAELGAYYITIMPSMKGFTSKVNKELRGLGATGGKDYSSGFLSSIKNSAIGVALGTMAVRAGDALVGGLSTGIDRADTLRNFPRVMETLGYSTDEAESSIQKIMERLKGLPASTQDVVRLTQAISDSTGDLGLATDSALAFTDAMIANGASAAEVTNAQGVLNRILGKGSATAAQWSSLTSIMPAQMDAVAKSMLGSSANSETLRAALEDGTVTWNDFLRAMVDVDQNGIQVAGKSMAGFEEQARANSDGIGTAIQNMSWRIGTGWANIINAIGVENISGPINELSEFIVGAMSGVGNFITDLKEKVGETAIFENVQIIMKNLGEKFGEFGDKAKDALDKAIPVIVDLIDKALQWLVDHGDQIGEIYDKVTGAIGDLADKISGALKEALPVVKDLVEDVLQWVFDNGPTVIPFIAGIASGMAAFATATAAYTAISGIATSLGALATVLPMVTTLADIPVAFALVAETGGPLAGMFAGLSAALGFLAANQIVLVIAAIAALVGGIATWILTTEEGKKAWEDFCNGVKGLVDGLKQDFDNAMAQIKQNLEDNAVQWEVFKTNVSNVIDQVKGFFGGLKDEFDRSVEFMKRGLDDNFRKWEEFKKNVSTTIENTKTNIANKFTEIYTNVTTTVENIRTSVSEKFTAAKEKALGIFDDIRNGIKEKVDWAYEKVKGIVDDIKGLFDFDWSLPEPKLPHVTWDWTDVGGIVSIPSFGVEWYGKGGVFDSASVIGIGERGREAALPLNDATYREIAEGITQKMDGPAQPTVLVTGNTFNVRDDTDIDRIADAIAVRTKRERGAGL